MELYYGNFHGRLREIVPDTMPVVPEYVPGKPQHMVEPHEIAHEVIQQTQTESLPESLPELDVPLLQNYESVDDMPESPRVRRHSSYGQLPYYRAMPIFYIPVNPAYLPYYTVYRY